MEEISLKKREIEAKMEEESASIAWLTESLTKSDQLANNMLNILTSFEERLCNLEDAILPVHRETTDLQRRQENVDKTLVLLDEVLSYHSVSSKLKPIIEEGPAGHLEDYLNSMKQIDEAIVFFMKNNPESIELSVLKSLNEAARESLEKEFRMLLTRHSKPVPVVTIQDVLNASIQAQNDASSQTSQDDTQIQHFSENVMNDLKTIANWLTENRKSTDFMSIYSQYRSTVLVQSMQGIKDEGFKFNFDISYGKKKAPLKRTPTDVYTKKKLGPRKSTKPVIETLYGHKRGPSTADVPAKDDDEESDVNKIDTFITCTGALLKLIQSERDLMDHIIPPERHIPIFSNLVAEAFMNHYRDAEVICSLAKSRQVKLDHSAIQLILPVMKYMQSVKQDFDVLLKLVNVDTRKKFLNIAALFKETASATTSDFMDKVKETKHVTMPKDGTVHQITTNVILFIEELIQYTDVTASLDLKDEDGNKIEITDKERKVARYIGLLLSALSMDLINRSKIYDQSPLKHIFLLNNYNYIVKSLTKSGIMQLLQENGQPNLQQDYDDETHDEMNNYLKSWIQLTTYIKINEGEKSVDAKGHLKDKYKQAIKDKFKGFNTDIEDIHQTHKQFAVPDSLLKEKIYNNICDLVLVKYKEFLKRYRDVHFTKNVEKYVKYDSEKLQKYIASIFDLEGNQ